jgi:NIMA (never in mitosis gene a)-related kinase
VPGVEKNNGIVATNQQMGVLHQNVHVLNAMGGVGAGVGSSPAGGNLLPGGGGYGGGGDKPAPVVAPRKNTTRMDDFTVVRKLGKGSFGVVWACTRKKDPSKKMLVVKEIKMGPKRSDQEDAINECRVLAKLDSQYVVKYFDSFIDKGCNLCIVMEYAPKGTVHHLIQAQKPRPLDEATVWKLMLQSTLGLHHIHQLKVLHRDIKSENIFLDARGNAKIGDLGVAKVMTTQVDFARTLVGTPYYLSPELCENKPYNHKSDIWSLGCVLYELLTGTHPFNATNQGALFIKILKGKYPPVKGFGADITALLDRCLAISTARRFDTKGILGSRAAHEKSLEMGLELPVDIPLPGVASAGGGVAMTVVAATAAAAAGRIGGGGAGGVRPSVPPGSGGVVSTMGKRAGPGAGVVGARAAAAAGGRARAGRRDALTPG